MPPNSDHSNSLSLEERQARLSEASRKYLVGEITIEEFEQAEREYGSRTRDALLHWGTMRARNKETSKKQVTPRAGRYLKR
jgi:hypothetical protein